MAISIIVFFFMPPRPEPADQNSKRALAEASACSCLVSPSAVNAISADAAAPSEQAQEVRGRSIRGWRVRGLLL
jgi:hypothetical protein